MDVDRLAEEIRKREEERRNKARDLRADLVEDGLEAVDGGPAIRTPESHDIDELTVSAVDGGLVLKELQSADIVMKRAVAAVVDYSGGEIADHRYVPGPTPSPQVDAFMEERNSSQRSAGLMRLETEIDTAIEAAADADIVLLDGSLRPHPDDRPSKESPSHEAYQRVLEKYRELYSIAEAGDVDLLGVVEDSRSADFCSFVQDNGAVDVPDDIRDTVLLDYILDANEMAGPVKSREGGAPGKGSEHEVQAIYLNTVEKDSPVRLEALGSSDIEALAGVVQRICGEKSSYAIPPILLEADNRASIDRNEVEILMSGLQSKLSHLHGFTEMRRERRPF